MGFILELITAVVIYSVFENWKTVILKENQSTYIPLGELHRLANPSDQPLEIIEVQSGKYLGEDDIIRYEDEYLRN